MWKKIVSFFLVVLLLAVPVRTYRARAQAGAIILGAGELLSAITNGLSGLGVDAELLGQIIAIGTQIKNGKEAFDDFSNKYGQYIQMGRDAYSLVQSCIYITEIWHSVDAFSQSIEDYYAYAKSIPDQNFYEVTQTVAQGERLLLSLTNEVAAVVDIIKGQMGTADAVATTGVLKDFYQRCEQLRYRWNSLAADTMPQVADPVGAEAGKTISGMFQPGGFANPQVEIDYSDFYKTPAALTAESAGAGRSGAKYASGLSSGNYLSEERGREVATATGKLGGGYVGAVMIIIGIIGLGFVVINLVRYLNGRGSAWGLARVLIGIAVTMLAIFLLKSMGGM